MCSGIQRNFNKIHQEEVCLSISNFYKVIYSYGMAMWKSSFPQDVLQKKK